MQSPAVQVKTAKCRPAQPPAVVLTTDCLSKPSQDVIYAVGGQGNQGKSVHPSIEQLDGERFTLLPHQMQVRQCHVCNCDDIAQTGLLFLGVLTCLLDMIVGPATMEGAVVCRPSANTSASAHLQVGRSTGTPGDEMGVSETSRGPKVPFVTRPTHEQSSQCAHLQACAHLSSIRFCSRPLVRRGRHDADPHADGVRRDL